MPQLIIKRGKVQIDRFPLNQDITTIGRGGSTDDPPDLELLDTHRRVSRYHAAFVHDADGRYWVVDLFSSNGTQVNGEMIYRKRLNNSDVVQIGDFRLIYDETERTDTGLPLLVLVDEDMSAVPGITGTSTVMREDQTHDGIELPDQDWIMLNDILTRLKHLGNSGAIVSELVMLLVSSMKADCGFVAVLHDEGVLVPLAAHGFNRNDNVRYPVSQECVQVALKEGHSILRTVPHGSALCCPVTDQSNTTGVLYLHSRNREAFAESSTILLDHIRDWIEDKNLPVMSTPPQRNTSETVSGHIKWPGKVVTCNHNMRKLLANLDRIAKSDTSVLFLGETGTGKEVLAERLHLKSSRAMGPWYPVELSGVEQQHVDGLLFGWEKGSFTSADQDRRGAFEIANGGTLFLDEIGDTSINVQAKLRRAVEEKQIQPIGSEKAIKIDTRVLAATNVDLKKAVAEGRFRNDLLMRFTSIENIPPLRDRLQELPLLFNYFIDLYEGSLVAVSRGAMRLLYRYSWPGNVREVRRMVQRWNNLGKKVAFYWDLPEEVINETAAFATDTDRFRTTKQIEKEEITRVLRMTKGNVERATKILGFGGKQTLYNKMKAFGLSPDNFRNRN
ncbi:MAG TPA: sigma 54-interacting transcriptional regulator [candidate division Zixibacteria bacterium]|nr:sigma 54-interacting transcriptional regulator [candidate division Zixibacteria bacterium]